MLAGRFPRAWLHGTAAFALLTLATPAAWAQTVVPPQDAGLRRLGRELARLAPHSSGTMGLAAIHLETGRAVYLNGDTLFPMASTYKVPIAVQLLTRVDRGEVTLDDMIRLAPEDLHPGSGTLTRLFDDPGVVLSVRNLLELMLLISDNSATDITLRTAGGPDAVNARMRALGIEALRVDRPTSTLIGDYIGVRGIPADGRIDRAGFRALAEDVDEDRREEAARTFAADPRDTSSPFAMGRLLELIWRGQALGEESTELLLDIMRRVETGEGRLRGLLPPDVDVAHKTGTIGPTTNDVGILYLPDDSSHVVTVVFVKDAEGDIPRRERAIAQVARAVYDYFLFNPGR